MPVRPATYGTTGFYGWKLLGALASLDLMNLAFPVTGGTVINVYMLRQIPMSRTTYGMGFTLLNVLVAFASVAAGVLVVKRGIKTTLAIGAGMILIGALGLSFLATRPWHFLVGFGVVIATGVGFGSFVPITTAVTRWFKRYRGRAMGLAFSISSLAGFFVPPAFDRFLIANGGNWRQAWQLVALVAAVSAIVALLFVKERPEDLGQLADGAPEIAAPLPRPGQDTIATTYAWTPREAYGTSSYWMIVIAGIGCKFPFFFILAHWILDLRASGLSNSQAVWAMASTMVAAVAGRLIGGWLVDKMPGRYAFMLGLCCTLAATILAYGNTLLIALAASIAFGVGFGWAFICMITLTAQYFGASAYPKLSGTLFLFTGIMSAPAGIVGGWLFDLYHSYSACFLVIFVLVAAGVLALGAAKPPRPPARVPTEALETA